MWNAWKNEIMQNAECFFLEYEGYIKLQTNLIKIKDR